MFVLSSGLITSADAADIFPVIEIDGNAELDDFMAVNMFDGSGTESDPYIIEYLDIDATGNDSAISLMNTDRHVVIRESVISNPAIHGIYLYNAANVTMLDNYFYLSTYGIYLERTVDITITGCDLEGSEVGIYLDGSDRTIIEDNDCSICLSAGIYLTGGSDDNVLRNNNCLNSQSGVIIQNESSRNLVEGNDCDLCASIAISIESSNDNVVTNNSCSGGGSGIVLFDANGTLVFGNTCAYLEDESTGVYLWESHGNEIAGNNCSYNMAGIGLRLSNDNIIDSNVLMGNDEIAIWLDTSSNNTISRNELTGNWNNMDMEYSDGNLVRYNNCSEGVHGAFAYESDFNIMADNNFTDTFYGVELRSSDNNSISGNTCNGTETYDGIVLNDSMNNTIDRNVCAGLNQYGILLQTGNRHNVITNNDCSNNPLGIALWWSDDNYVMGNNCSDCSDRGIDMSESNGNIIEENECDGNGRGIHISYSDDNVISNNRCDWNTYGIYLYGSDGNTVTSNTCENNSIYGTYLYDSDRNDVANNTCTSPEMFYQSATFGIYLKDAWYNNITSNVCRYNGDGIGVVDSSFNNITANDLSYNDGYLGVRRGIFIQWSSDNVVSNNTCTNNSVGISMSGGPDRLLITGNDLSNNGNRGIEVYNGDCEGLTISYNICNGNGYGMWLEAVSDSQIVWNVCEGNGKVGIYAGNNCDDNLIANNTMRDNGYLLEDDGYGMVFAGNGLVLDGGGGYYSCDRNVVADNTIEGSRLYGMYAAQSANNMIYGNLFIGNSGSTSVFSASSVQAFDDGTNQWNSGSYGNLWSDWASPDVDQDGIVDDPYMIDGGANADLYPMSISVTIVSPVNGSYTNAVSVDIQGGAVSYFGVSTITWRNEATNASGACDGADDWNATVSLAEGENLITVTMTDLGGFHTTDTVVIVLDTVPPSLQITSPANLSTVGASFTITWSGSDPGSGISGYQISIDGGGWQTASSPYAVQGMAQGDHTIVVRASDRAGNSVTASLNVTVDTVPPTVDITSPSNGHVSTNGDVTLVWTGNDSGAGISHYEVSWDGRAPIRVSAGTLSYAISGLSDGEHVLRVRAVDLAGLSSYDEIDVVVDTGAPSLDITSPGDGSFTNQANVTVTWTSADLGVGISHFLVSLDGGEAVQLGPDARNHAFVSLAEGPHTVNLTAVDQLGNNVSVEIAFTVDTIAPALEITSPVEGSITNANIIVIEWLAQDGGSGIASVEFSYDGSIWISVTGSSFTTGELQDGNVTLHVRVADRAGNSISKHVNLTVDTVAPTAQVTPTGAWVSISETITGTFSEGMNESTVILVVSGLAGEVMWDGNTIVFHPLAPMMYGSTYTVNLTGEDLAGNKVEMTWSFTTEDVTIFVGIAKDADGTPIEGVLVTIGNATYSQSQLTGADGRFSFSIAGNITGPFTITLEKEGYKTIMVGDLIFEQGGSEDLGSLTMTGAVEEADGDDSPFLMIIGVIAVLCVAVAAVFMLKRRK